MSVITEADKYLVRAKEYIEKARHEIGKVLIEPEMWGAQDYHPGYLKNCFWRVDALLRALNGEDLEGNKRATEIPPV